MRRRRKPRGQNHERWLVSYADFITLLFAFFVVMYASAQVDKRRVAQLAFAIQVAFQKMGVFPGSSMQMPRDLAPMPYANAEAVENTKRAPDIGPLVAAPKSAFSIAEETQDLTELRKELEKALAVQIQQQEVALHAVPEGLVVSLREIGFFDSGSAEMKPRSRPAFQRLALILSQGTYHIRIEGHTDDVPVHNAHFSSNWELSTARATEIVQLLLTKYDFAPERLSAAGYAQYHPVASNSTAEGRAQNRRVDIVVLGRLRGSTVALAPGALPAASAGHASGR